MFLKVFKFRNQDSDPVPIVHFKGQNYDDLLKDYSKENLFEDPEFPADNSSLYTVKECPSNVIWKRPHEAMNDPQFVVGGFGRCDMDQGYIGNCWFIAACVGIMQNKKMFARIVPRNQSFTENYTGMFCFKFWLYGDWVSVVVDDRLPFWPNDKLVFCSNKQQPNELWGSLLEKAYAKIYGSYENLESGQTYDALIDMSGGIQEQINLTVISSEEKKNFWNTIFTSFKKESIIGCNILPDPYVKEARLSNGLVKGHAYTITKIVIIDYMFKTEKLLRIRNPWGNEVEWKGAWSDDSKEWKLLSQRKKNEMDYLYEADGEFWISFSDFMSNFDIVQICHLDAGNYSNKELDHIEKKDLNWKCTTYHSCFEPGVTAGGCGKDNPCKYWTNPQFLIKLIDYDLTDEDNQASLMVALMQKDTRLKRSETKTESAEAYIQFRLYIIKEDVEIDETKSGGLKLNPNQLERVGGSGNYINSREVTRRFKLDPGYYLIIPSTYDEDQELEFMLRIFTENPIETNDLNQSNEISYENESNALEAEEDYEFIRWSNTINKENNEETDVNNFKKSCQIM